MRQLKCDATGLSYESVDGTVTLNVMKALLSMDFFELLPSYYGSDSKVRAFQQKMNQQYESYIGLAPCDGVYGRNTNKALVYALQAAEGLPIGTANGNFGVTTQKCCPTIPYIQNSNSAKNYSGNYYNDAKISIFTEFVQFALYVNGFDTGDIDGVFDSDTQSAITSFQQSFALPVSGIADKGTWLSLFISSGDTTRSAVAADCATQLNSSKAQALYNNGYRYIGRYLTGTAGGVLKNLTKTEAQAILNAKLKFFPIYQSGGTSNEYFTKEQGALDAESAINAAAEIGIPKGTIIYFAIDYDSLGEQIESNVIPYFEGVSTYMLESMYKVGIYGTRNACSQVSEKGYAVSSFVANSSTGFSGNLGFKMPDNWAFDQFATKDPNDTSKEIMISADTSFPIDKDGFSGRDQGVSSLDSTSAKKAIYVLPGYLASELYDEDNIKLWVSVTSILSGIGLEKFNQDKNSNGTQLHVDASLDDYGAQDNFESLIKRLRKDFSDTHDVIYFPYNWLENLNDSVINLENDIVNNGYTDIIFVTHSTGGLLASAYIAKSNTNKLKIDKAILIAPPLFGTYASLLPIERGDSKKLFNGTPMDALIDAFTDNDWIKGWAKNSPTTYQLLPSSEYLQHYKLKDVQGWADGTSKYSDINDFYKILNQSENINPKLTNGSNKSHQYFRETVLKNDIVSVLSEVDTILIGTASGHSTTSIAIYKEPLIGTNRVFKDIEYNKNGDGTVQGISAQALRKGETTPVLEADFSYSSAHSKLLKDPAVLEKVSLEISREIFKSSLLLHAFKADYTLDTETNNGMSNLLKIRYTADKPVTATIYNDSNEIIAQATNKDYTGFDNNDFIYDDFSDTADVSEASIYMPNTGYKLVFSYGSATNTTVNFEAEVSTLDYDGWKTISVANNIAKTTTNGIITSFDSTVTPLNDDNISTTINGTVTNHLTDWELPNTIKLEKNTNKTINLTGSQATEAKSVLEWYSADETIATVSSTGVIKGVGFGKTIITVSNGNKTSSCEVTVMQKATSVNISNINLVIDERKAILPEFTPVSSTETNLAYTYDKGGIIRIDNGVITALAEGTLNVSATTDYGVTDTFVVTVTNERIELFGDINIDGVENVEDIVTMKNYALGVIKLNAETFPIADLNDDNRVDVYDIAILKRYYLRKGLK
ncbi:MAG: DUF1906 domain-containing protein [Oscillospiraceae bacterium]|nr:DUF1906 domain-containing protein [Oscillospiraceae bacterium]